jgi:hypothetical protein
MHPCEFICNCAKLFLDRFLNSKCISRYRSKYWIVIKRYHDKASTYTHFRGVGVRVAVGSGGRVDVAVGIEVPGVEETAVTVGIFALVGVPTGSVV